jgi:hypothetical protein
MGHPLMAGKPGLDIGLIFGSPKKKPGGMMEGGPDDDFRTLAKTVLSSSEDMDARIDALHEAIMACMDMGKSDETETSDEAPASERGEA